MSEESEIMRKNVDDGEVCVSTHMSLDRSFTGANG
jgi:hypothetical protein